MEDPAPPPAPGVLPPSPPRGVLPPSSPESAAIARDFARTLHELTPHVWVTWVLIAANVAIYGIMIAQGVDPMEPKIVDLLKWGANYTPMTTNGQQWRMVTAMFLHIGALHIAMNMIVLFSIGRFVEKLVGTSSFVVTYLVAGLAGSIVSTIANPNVVSAGASGAVFGLYGALLGFLARDRTSIPKPVLNELVRSAIIFIGYNVIYGLSQKNIDQGAHFGGLAGGFVCGLILSQPVTLAARAGRLKRMLAVFVFGAGLAAYAVLGIGAKSDFSADLQRALAPEAKLLADYNATYAKLGGGELTEPAFADALERDLIPGWRAMEAETAKIKAPNDKAAALLDLMKRYLEVRREAFEALIAVARGDGAQQAVFKSKQDEATRLLEQMRVMGQQ